MQSYVRWILRHRLMVIGLVLAVTAVLLPQAKHLRVVIDPNTMLPQSHPYVIATNRIADLFGSRHVVIIGVTPKQGDIFQSGVLSKIQRITADVLHTPGAVKENVTSLSARRVKDISGHHDQLEVRPLMASVPQTASQMDKLRQAVQRNPVYWNTIISADKRTAAVIAEFKDSESGFRGIMDSIAPILDRERDASVDIVVGGFPVFLSRIEVYSDRVIYLLPVAILIIALLHLEAFRTVQGLILPLVTALLATGWDMGVMGIAGIPFDVVTVTAPVVILAVAAGHAVQLLKRYYEEYYQIRETTSLSRLDASNAAIVRSLVRMGPVMLIAGTVAALGFFSLVVFTIPMVRTMGMVTGIGIVFIMILEMTFIPALRSLLSPPDDTKHFKHDARIWDRITDAIVRWVTGPHRRRLYGFVLALLALSAVGATRIVMDNSVKSYFSNDLPFQKDDRALNDALGGTNTLYLLVEGSHDDAIKEPAVLRAMESTQRFLEQQPSVGKSMSIADFIKRIHQAMHNDDAAYYRIPESRELISQYLLLYSMSGEPSDFDSYVDYQYRSANITAFLKSDSSAYLGDLVERLKRYAATQFGKDVHLTVGGSAPQNAALSDVLVHNKIQNLLLFGTVIFLISSIVFRSILGGALVAIPLFVTVMLNFGLMGWSGIKLNIPTSICFTTIIGIGADYAIYLIYRVREQIMEGVEEMTAIRTVLGTAGQASLYVASAVAGGYSVLLFSIGFYVHIWMGILIASAMVASVFSALTLIPALILTLRPRFIFRREPLAGVPASVTAGILAAAIFGLSLALPKSVWAADQTVTAIMEKNFVSTKVGDSLSDSTLILIQKTGQERVRKISSTTKLQPNGVDNMRVTRFLAPPDVKGTVTLLIERSDQDDDMWVYLPALKKVRRLVSSNKKDSFMGTDFSYGDVIGHKVDDWKHRLLGEEVVDGKACYIVESVPKSESVKSNNGYSKRVNWIRKDNYVTIKEESWDEAGQPLKTITLHDIRLVDPVHNKWQPMSLRAVNQQTGHRTDIEIRDFKVNQGVKGDFFTTRYMERGA